MSQIVRARLVHGAVNIEVTLCGQPAILFPLIHKFFPQTSLISASVAPIKYFRSFGDSSSSSHKIYLADITRTEMKLAEISLGRYAEQFSPMQIKVAEELNHLLFRVLRGMDQLPESYPGSADVAVYLAMEGDPSLTGLRTISNPEAVSHIRIQSHYQVAPGCEVLSRWLPDLTAGRSQQCLDEVKSFSRSLGNNHQKTLESAIKEVSLFYRKRTRVRQQTISSLAHRVLGPDADGWLNGANYRGLSRLKRLDSDYEFKEALNHLSALNAPQPPASRGHSKRRWAALAAPSQSSSR